MRSSPRRGTNGHDLHPLTLCTLFPATREFISGAFTGNRKLGGWKETVQTVQTVQPAPWAFCWLPCRNLTRQSSRPANFFCSARPGIGV